MISACAVRVRGVVQGVGFRPFVVRLARANTLAGWVLNEPGGVEIYLEGATDRLQAFLQDLELTAPPAATISAIDVETRVATGLRDFTVRSSLHAGRPTARIAPDTATCERCLRELFDPADARFHYPYINCTDCGPRYSIVTRLPYDRDGTTMRDWPMDERCSREFHDPENRRFHAQPVACPACGPRYTLRYDGAAPQGTDVAAAAQLLAAGKILAVKGLGGYHLACDARNPAAVRVLRQRKFRKEKPFAVMARDLEVARTLIVLRDDAVAVLSSPARPIVLAPALVRLPEVAPDNADLGVMLPYTPLHHLLFRAGAPEVLVMTSGNRSSEPIAFTDAEALERLTGLADGFLVGQRPIARRVDDSVVQCRSSGPFIVRRSRGYAPGVVAQFPAGGPILAVGADLKNTITLVVDGQAIVSQHIGDLEHYDAFRAFEATIGDLLSMYEVNPDDLIVVRDRHPQYRSSLHAGEMPVSAVHTVQHHRAHIASVLAERGAWDTPVLGVSADGTGYGDDGTIWGCELFAGSLRDGLERVGHLREAALVGGDAAARRPLQAAAGFLELLDHPADLTAPPFAFPEAFDAARQLLHAGTRIFPTTSMGRLFDTASALLGFHRPVTFEGQAAVRLEQLARSVGPAAPYPFPFDGTRLDYHPLLHAVITDRLRGRDVREVARAFHAGVARGLARAAAWSCIERGLGIVVLSGGVFQNQLVVEDVRDALEAAGLEAWLNHDVPANDGGVSLGQAASAACGSWDQATPEVARTRCPSSGTPAS